MFSKGIGLRRDWLDWFIGRGLDSNGCLLTERPRTDKTGCIGCSRQGLEAQGSPGELLAFRPHWNPKEIGSNTREGNGSGIDYMTWPWEIVRQADRQQKTYFSMSLHVECHQNVWLRFRVGLLTPNYPDEGWVST